ncbi:hypothetical protein EX30DRAFT_343663 [Ascodesmis nigricans]|uniref:Uncharacterized protein n=1 Tax=Ascodesmis nigricans TaxID=341454 RepID=A0A4S2MLX1_9PEZI|nr:hypothetical protein EX30DRAFT_343663 [Ascodesmis nigricans]
MATAKRDPSPKLRRSDYLSFFGSAKGREFLNNLERKHATAKRRVGGRSVSSTAPTATTITDAIARATNPIPGDEIGNGQSSSAQVVRRESLLEDEDEDEGECRNNDNDASGGNHVAAVVVECVVEQQESTSQWEGLHQLSSVSGAVAAPPHSRAHAEESGIANGDDDEDRVVNHGYGQYISLSVLGSLGRDPLLSVLPTTCLPSSAFIPSCLPRLTERENEQ